MTDIRQYTITYGSGEEGSLKAYQESFQTRFEALCRMREIIRAWGLYLTEAHATDDDFNTAEPGIIEEAADLWYRHGKQYRMDYSVTVTGDLTGLTVYTVDTGDVPFVTNSLAAALRFIMSYLENNEGADEEYPCCSEDPDEVLEANRHTILGLDGDFFFHEVPLNVYIG